MQLGDLRWNIIETYEGQGVDQDFRRRWLVHIEDSGESSSVQTFDEKRDGDSGGKVWGRRPSWDLKRCIEAGWVKELRY